MFSNGQFVRIYREEHASGVRSLNQLSAVLELLKSGNLDASGQKNIASLAEDLTRAAIDAFSEPAVH